MRESEQMIQTTRNWIQRFVVRYRLCPFAKPVVDRNTIEYKVSTAHDPELLLEDVIQMLERFSSVSVEEVETSFLIHPWVLQDFLEYNDFLTIVDHVIAELGLEGLVQVASFHPDYLFAGSNPEDVENATNRSPYPMLHFLREEGMEEALHTFPNPEEIPVRNEACMRSLGADTIQTIQASCFEVD